MKSLAQKFQIKVLKVGQKEEDKTVDPRYDSAKEQWLQFVSQAEELKTAIAVSVAHLRGLASSSIAASAAFETLFAGSSHAVAGIPSETKRIHTDLDQRTAEMNGKLNPVGKCEELLARFAELKARADSREKARELLDFHRAKLASAQKDYDKHVAAGKMDAKEAEKMSKLQQKTEEANRTYEQENAALLADLTYYNEKKAEILAPILQDWLALQAQFGSALNSAAASCHELARGKGGSWEEALAGATALTGAITSSISSAVSGLSGSGGGEAKAATAPAPGAGAAAGAEPQDEHAVAAAQIKSKISGFAASLGFGGGAKKDKDAAAPAAAPADGAAAAPASAPAPAPVPEATPAGSDPFA